MQRVLDSFCPPRPAPFADQLRAVANRGRRWPVLHSSTFTQSIPRFKIDIDKEQQRLLAHDVIVFQFPTLLVFRAQLCSRSGKTWCWSTASPTAPAGDKLAGKTCLLAVTAGAPQDSYRDGRNEPDLPYATLLTARCSKRSIFARWRTCHRMCCSHRSARKRARAEAKQHARRVSTAC